MASAAAAASACCVAAAHNNQRPSGVGGSEAWLAAAAGGESRLQRRRWQPAAWQLMAAYQQPAAPSFWPLAKAATLASVCEIGAGGGAGSYLAGGWPNRREKRGGVINQLKRRCNGAMAAA